MKITKIFAISVGLFSLSFSMRLPPLTIETYSPPNPPVRLNTQPDAAVQNAQQLALALAVAQQQNCALQSRLQEAEQNRQQLAQQLVAAQRRNQEAEQPGSIQK